MPLISTRTLMDEARAAGRGLAAFNVIHLESAEAILGGAGDAGLPVILQISENCVSYHGGLAPIAAASLAAAQASGTRAALHLDHAESPELVYEALDLGFGSVMFDASKLPDEQNRRLTSRWWSAPTPPASLWRRSWERWAARTARTPPA